MSQIMVYKSDADGKLFEDKKKYQLHLRKLASARLAEKKVAQMDVDRAMFLVKMGQVENIDALNQFIKDNWKWFWANGARYEHYKWNSNKGKAPSFHEYYDVSVIDAYWKDSLSNSHSCPRGGVQNFDRRADCNKDKPTGYPGWNARINIKVKPPMSNHKRNPFMYNGWGSSYFENTTICTGSGGGGGGKDYKSYSYDCKLWAADFPVMFEQHMRERWVEQENDRRAREWRYLGGKGNVPTISEIPDDWTCPDPMLEYSVY